MSLLLIIPPFIAIWTGVLFIFINKSLQKAEIMSIIEFRNTLHECKVKKSCKLV